MCTHTTHTTEHWIFHTEFSGIASTRTGTEDQLQTSIFSFSLGINYSNGIRLTIMIALNFQWVGRFPKPGGFEERIQNESWKVIAVTLWRGWNAARRKFCSVWAIVSSTKFNFTLFGIDKLVTVLSRRSLMTSPWSWLFKGWLCCQSSLALIYAKTDISCRRYEPQLLDIKILNR